MVRIEATERTEPPRSLALVGACLVAAIALALLQPQPGAAASLAGKDGLIHACFKAKGKGKGNLKVLHGAKAKCPKGWKKTAWVASAPSVGPVVGQTGPRGEQGSAGQSGATGAEGATGATGGSESVVVTELETKVTELLTKVQGLESVLAGVTNLELKEAIEGVGKIEALETVLAGISNLELKEAIENIAKVEALEGILAGVTNSDLLDAIGLAPAVNALCAQTEELNGQTTALGSTLGALDTVLGTVLGILFTPPTNPSSLPAFVCPSN
jgi:hypothetical protein